MDNTSRKIGFLGIWGDSILKGVVLDEVKGSYSMLKSNCVHLFEKQLDIPVLNRSRFGFTIKKGYRHLMSALEKGLSCDMVLLEYGGNDCDYDWSAVSADPDGKHQPHTPLPVFCQTLDQMIEALRQKGIKPVLMSLPPINSEKYFNFLVSNGHNKSALMHFLGDVNHIYQHQETYSLEITKAAYQQGCYYVPVREAFLSADKNSDFLCLDGIHPNQEGHQLMKRVFSDYALKLADAPS